MSGTPFTKQMFFKASAYNAGIPGIKVTRVPVVIAAASSSDTNSGAVDPASLIYFPRIDDVIILAKTVGSYNGNVNYSE
jgi:hypothetical protein